MAWVGGSITNGYTEWPMKQVDENSKELERSWVSLL